jgi:predicted dehydrogenase
VTDRALPLRIGVLGAARIAEEAIVGPAQALGHRLVAVAARDRRRADAFADRYGVERVLDGYADVVADPEVELVYNPLPNALHGPWNLEAVRVGKPVLSEKPFASCGAEAEQVRDAGREAGVPLLEGFHYLYHPLMRRLEELLEGGELGELREVESALVMPAPDEEDPRWSFELAGGAMMDLGCYALHFARQLGSWASGGPRVVEAAAVARDGRPSVDQRLSARLEYPSGVTARIHCDMAATHRSFTWRVRGSRGEASAANFVKPQADDRLTVVDAAGQRVEHVGTRSSYEFQLEAVAAHLRHGAPLRIDSDDAVQQMRLVDDCYSAAGLPLRPRRDAAQMKGS